MNQTELTTNPKAINGLWDWGKALDNHTILSTPLGPDEWGHEQFDTTRTDVGEALYKLKYRGDRSQLDPLARAVVAFIKRQRLPQQKQFSDLVSAIIPVPPSQEREFQPLLELARIVGCQLGVPVPLDYLVKTKRTPALKNIDDQSVRHRELEGAFSVIDRRYADRRLFLFDDIYRSGETMNAITKVLKRDGHVIRVYALTLTKTRSNT